MAPQEHANAQTEERFGQQSTHKHHPDPTQSRNSKIGGLFVACSSAHESCVFSKLSNDYLFEFAGIPAQEEWFVSVTQHWGPLKSTLRFQFLLVTTKISGQVFSDILMIGMEHDSTMHPRLLTWKCFVSASNGPDIVHIGRIGVGAFGMTGFDNVQAHNRSIQYGVRTV